MNKRNVFYWILVMSGLILLNWFPDIISNSYSGLVLAMGVILFVNGCIGLQTRAILNER